MKQRGYTLVELLVAVSIIGILAAVAVPMYQDYATTSIENAVKNGLRTIYLQQQEYFSNNGVYYSSGASCDDYTNAINTNLFGGKQILVSGDYTYCITQTTTADFTAQAEEVGGSQIFTINHNNVTSF